jgi:hypothetical protein
MLIKTSIWNDNWTVNKQRCRLVGHLSMFGSEDQIPRDSPTYYLALNMAGWQAALFPSSENSY